MNKLVEGYLWLQTCLSEFPGEKNASVRAALDFIEQALSERRAEPISDVVAVASHLENALGCFNAAIAEGLYDRLVEQEPYAGGIRDLIERRVLHAQSYIMAAIAAMQKGE
jgi:hypothetical protein